tara:strand:- start:614 stop:1813 length:1200 start_codon:yes stop_codon:yes gene_type:complete
MNTLITQELKYGAHNYKSLPICIKKAKGIYLTDTNNNKYLDFLSSYSAVNQGHCHPKIYNTLLKQANTLTLTSRAYHNDKLGSYMKFITNLFGYDKVLPMNTGVEAGETAIKIARKWGYNSKNIPHNKAQVIFPKNNFWGRTITACSTSTDPSCYVDFGPFTKGFDTVDYNDIYALERKFYKNPYIVAYMMEPIQGEAGVILPDEGYLKKVKELCKKYNVLMIADEIQTGLGRTGKMLACDYEGIQPDILCLGKALSGGFMPISAVLANNNIMKYITPGTHGSTFGGNPLASSIAITALNIIKDENLIENSFSKGLYFRKELSNFNKDFIIDIRGKGLLNAIEFENDVIAKKICHELLNNGLVSNITHGNIIRLSPPLVINQDEIDKSLNIIYQTIKYI